MGHRAWHTFAKLPVLALINDLKKKLRKKLYVTIPQWSEAFRNMSHLRSGWNRAKCGLQLNDPIDCFKLRLNQPKMTGNVRIERSFAPGFSAFASNVNIVFIVTRGLTQRLGVKPICYICVSVKNDCGDDTLIKDYCSCTCSGVGEEGLGWLPNQMILTPPPCPPARSGLECEGE